MCGVMIHFVSAICVIIHCRTTLERIAPSKLEVSRILLGLQTGFAFRVVLGFVMNTKYYAPKSAYKQTFTNMIGVSNLPRTRFHFWSLLFQHSARNRAVAVGIPPFGIPPENAFGIPPVRHSDRLPGGWTRASGGSTQGQIDRYPAN